MQAAIAVLIAGAIAGAMHDGESWLIEIAEESQRRDPITGPAFFYGLQRSQVCDGRRD